MKKYRDTGAKGALLDEYERAILDLKEVVKSVGKSELVTIADPDTSDPDCKSIQTILAHVVRAGYGYAWYIRNHLGEKLPKRETVILDDPESYIVELDDMFKVNEQLFEDYPDLELEEYNCQKKMLTNWGQYYDPEQILEHAIVHILRHRRQIERFLIKLRN